MALARPRVAALDVVLRLPAALRAVVRRLPQRLQPAPDPAVGLVALDGGGRVVEQRTGLLDGFGMLTGVRESAGTLWLGSLTADRVATLPR